jgi:hypothetical protein
VPSKEVKDISAIPEALRHASAMCRVIMTRSIGITQIRSPRSTSACTARRSAPAGRFREDDRCTR